MNYPYKYKTFDKNVQNNTNDMMESHNDVVKNVVIG